MQTTTVRSEHNLKAQRLIEVRAQIKALQIEEKALKAHFSRLMDIRESDSLLVRSAIIISRYHRTRETFDTKRLTSWFNDHEIDAQQFKNITHYETLTAKAI